MAASEYREIPYNYTSASDEQVVTFLFGSDTWSVLERLRARRVTGRSARLLLRFMGDLFVVRRNPFLFQQLVDARPRRREFLALARRDLEVIERNGRGQALVEHLVRACREQLQELHGELVSVKRRRRRIQRGLGAVVGEANVTFEPFALISHATDATDWRLHLPLCVVRPATEDQVSPLLAAIAQLGLHAIPRGAGTGLTGGAVPLHRDCVMVNTERLTAIRGITVTDTDAGSRAVMEVEAGVVTEDAMQAAREQGLVFATDPTSAWACTVGGNLAENAGGKSAVLWGTAIDNVLSFRMALPGGTTCEVTREEHPWRKIQPHETVRFSVRSSDGALDRTVCLRGDEIRKPGLWKDITNKALGGVPGLQKEGTDGVITSARFVLHPAYPEQTTACLEFFGESMDEAARVILEIAEQFPNRGEEALLALEHFDEEYVKAIDYRTKAPRDERPKAVLLIDIVGWTRAQIDRGRARLAALLEPFPETHAFFARDAAEAVRFWQDRKKLGAIAKRTNAFKLNEDIVLPLEALAEFARFIDQLNVAEDRHNQAAAVEAVRALLPTLQPIGDAEWLEAKMPRALALCDKLAARLRETPPDALRRREAITELRRDLGRLFAGYEKVTGELDAALDTEHERRIVIATHMHAGDGNVHVNIPVFSNDREMMRRATATADTVMEQAVALGGVVSGEHGIGITKLKHLRDELVTELETHRAEVDPGRVMNPDKLSDRGVLDMVFTPSFNLLELEARILQHDQLKTLADKISKCVRCGKCKPNCCVYYPDQQLFFHPRNKNLAIGSLIEALLYESQRFRSADFESLAYLENVADHCTICHKCLEPCPVKIDSGEVSILERRILAGRGKKKTALPTRLTLSYLNSTNRTYNALFRALVLRLGTALQRLGARLARLLPPSALNGGPLALLRSPVPAPARVPLHRQLPVHQPNQASVIEPASEATRTVFYFPGCGSERLHSDVGRAAMYVLLAAGCRVVTPPPLLCCGFPTGVNAKVKLHDRKVLADTIVFSQIREMFAYLDFDAVVFSCGTCREALQHMGAADIFGCALRDVAEVALESGVAAPTDGTFLYHRPCHDSLDGRGVELLSAGGASVHAVPHCCSEAGTLSLSRPDISHKMLTRKAVALAEAAERHPTPGGHRPSVLTNCPSCLQGLGRQVGSGLAPEHIAITLARHHGGDDWRRELAHRLRRAEVVNF
jgi:FAD/FMN-containing dehydrogenase/Fe-S oxidoreductase